MFCALHGWHGGAATGGGMWRDVRLACDGARHAARRAALCATDFAAAAKGVRRYCAVPHKALPRTRAQHTGQHKV